MHNSNVLVWIFVLQMSYFNSFSKQIECMTEMFYEQIYLIQERLNLPRLPKEQRPALLTPCEEFSIPEFFGFHILAAKAVSRI